MSHAESQSRRDYAQTRVLCDSAALREISTALNILVGKRLFRIKSNGYLTVTRDC